MDVFVYLDKGVLRRKRGIGQDGKKAANFLYRFGILKNPLAGSGENAV